MVVSIDANFRLSNRLNKSTEDSDPCLTDGKAFVVNSEEYREFIKDSEGKNDEQPVRQP